MPERLAALPSGWSLTRDENIVNVERIKLTLEEQRELNCTIGEFVFLEYPWVYVRREAVTRLAEKTDSNLHAHKDEIQKYRAREFLIGYTSTELTSTDFAICLSESARDKIRIRNREITHEILKKVTGMMRKTPGVWNSLKSNEELDRSFVKITRPFVEIEVLMPAFQLGRKRDLGDRDTDQARDGYVEILAGRREYRNVRMTMISRCIQTTLQGREVSVQSYFGYPKNKWTQYDDVVFAEPDVIRESDENLEESVGESENLEEAVDKADKPVDDVIEQIPKGPTSLDTFLDSRSEEMIDYARYNSVINVHSDDIDNLARRCVIDAKSEVSIGYEEIGSFIFLGITKRKFISDVSWHPTRPDYFAICYVNVPYCDLIDSPFERKWFDSSQDFDSGVLVWSLADTLRPKLLLRDVREIHAISFCPYRENVVIGGSTNGQIVLWDLDDCLEEDHKKDQTNGSEDDDDLTDCPKFHETGVPIVVSIASSDRDNSHVLPIRAIRWLPSDCRIDSSGKLIKLEDTTSVQFMTASEDGSVAMWDLLWQPHLNTSSKSLKSIVAATMAFSENLGRLDGIFVPHYRLLIRSSRESINMTLLDLCLPSIGVFKAEGSQRTDAEEKSNPTRHLWLGTAQGRMILGSWRGEDFGSDVTTSEVCEILDESTVHDGPVIKIARCPQIEELLLTIGGHVFAIWKDDYLGVPLLWRRRATCGYTACCWSAENPGVFLVGRNDGDLETWDISRKTKEPVHVRTVSGNSITGLYEARGLLNGATCKVIGVSDHSGVFRVYKEMTDSPNRTAERLRWFRDYVTREAARKREFRDWQNEYLKSNEKALERRATRLAEEARRRHEEARENFIREQEELARLKAERKARSAPKSKNTLRRAKNLEIAKAVLLRKKGFAPEKLENARLPLIRQQDEKNQRFHKAQKEISNQEAHFNDVLSFEFPNSLRHTKTDLSVETEMGEVSSNEIREKDFQKYSMIREEALKILAENPPTPKFDWNAVMEEGRRRKRH